jgi:hypothetical protein
MTSRLRGQALTALRLSKLATSAVAVGKVGHREKENKMNYNPIITCSDGFTISVQGHAASYSTRDDSGALTKVECGFPSTTPKTAELLRYAEDIDFTETVYGWVPVDVVQAELDAHGGIVDGRLPK